MAFFVQAWCHVWALKNLELRRPAKGVAGERRNRWVISRTLGAAPNPLHLAEQVWIEEGAAGFTIGKNRQAETGNESCAESKRVLTRKACSSILAVKLVSKSRAAKQNKDVVTRILVLRASPTFLR
jgi:hypothetical protein